MSNFPNGNPELGYWYTIWKLYLTAEPSEHCLRSWEFYAKLVFFFNIVSGYFDGLIIGLF